MEFETDKPVTADAAALADIPHLTVQPAHYNVTADLSDAPRLGTTQADGNFDFEAESTATRKESVPEHHFHPHQHTAGVVAGGIAILFAAIVALGFFYLHR